MSKNNMLNLIQDVVDRIIILKDFHGKNLTSDEVAMFNINQVIGLCKIELSRHPEKYKNEEQDKQPEDTPFENQFILLMETTGALDQIRKMSVEKKELSFEEALTEIDNILIQYKNHAKKISYT